MVPRQGKSLFWDETCSSVRLNVFNLDVFELVAIERLSGRDTPNQYNTALFKETLSDVERHLPHLELQSGRLYTLRRPRATICRRWSRMTSTGLHTLHLPVVTTGTEAR